MSSSAIFAGPEQSVLRLRQPNVLSFHGHRTMQSRACFLSTRWRAPGVAKLHHLECSNRAKCSCFFGCKTYDTWITHGESMEHLERLLKTPDSCRQTPVVLLSKRLSKCPTASAPGEGLLPGVESVEILRRMRGAEHLASSSCSISLPLVDS